MRQGAFVIALLAGRNVVKGLRTPALYAVALLQPIIWLVLFSQTFARLGHMPQFRQLGYDSYLDFLVPGMLVLSTLFTALQSGMATVSDIDSGVLERLLTSPIRRFSVLLGRYLADAVLMLVQGALVLLVATVMGAHSATGMPGMLGLLVLVTLFGIVWSALANLIALYTRNSELTMVLGFFLTLPVLFLSSSFFPLTLQPRWLQSLAHANPAAYVIAAGQALMNLGNNWNLDARTAVFLLALGLVLTGAAAAALRRSTV